MRKSELENAKIISWALNRIPFNFYGFSFNLGGKYYLPDLK